MQHVLILVLVEHTLGGATRLPVNKPFFVLILVLVEHTLGGGLTVMLVSTRNVLILVLVEHTLGEAYIYDENIRVISLNPCFSGTYSRRLDGDFKTTTEVCLNPCFSGTYSRRAEKASRKFTQDVLILVLVEHTLGEKTNLKQVD